ncbi:MAG: sulfur oxidation c-type cytochrome SoxA [Pseudomonadota bacterium]
MKNKSVYSHLRNAELVSTGALILGMLSLLACVPAVAQEDHAAKKHQQMQQGKKMQHGGGHMQHGMVAKGAEKFPTTGYNETKTPRPVEHPSSPKMAGDPKKGKKLAYMKNKGRCLSCHIMGPDGEQGGNVGPNLSTYGKLERDSAYTFQQIWDARAHNPASLMPPFGTNEILTKHEVVHIVAYINTLKSLVNAPKRAQLQERNFDVAGEDFTLADIYIEKGEALFRKAGKNGKSCASCHSSANSKGPNLKGIASIYPKYDSGLKRVMGLEQQINVCQKKYKNSKPYRLGSMDSNVVTSYVKFLSRRMPVNVSTEGPAAVALERGKTSFFQKAGQLNFSCADCHTTSAGKWLRGQSLSAIKPEGKYSFTASTWPKHFIAGHDLGLISLRQRIRHCQVVTRTKPLKLHSQEYTDLELYLMMLANGKPMLAPTKSKLRGSD